MYYIVLIGRDVFEGCCDIEEKVSFICVVSCRICMDREIYFCMDVYLFRVLIVNFDNFFVFVFEFEVDIGEC